MPTPAGTVPAMERSTGKRTRKVNGPAAPHCSRCVSAPRCIPQGSARHDLRRLDAIISATSTLRRGDALYGAGDLFSNVYLVRTGSLKTVVSSPDGRDQITGLYFAGEPFGLNGISTGTHNDSAIALEESSVCIVPYNEFASLCHESAALQDQFYRLMSGQINRVFFRRMLLASYSAEERIAALLLDVSDRYGKRGFSRLEFRLELTREEIGSYLGLTPETVSRYLTRLHRRGLIDVDLRFFRILDIEGLRRV
jgi:CRP/FNR family transcriptional regulator, anaerobic regulatory protein